MKSRRVTLCSGAADEFGGVRDFRRAFLWGKGRLGMRMWQWAFLMAVFGVVLTLWRDLSGRVGVIVFLIGAAEVACGTTAVMMLFRTLGAIGYARTFTAYLEALIGTLVVLACASLVMTGIFVAGYRLVRFAIRM